MREDGRLEKAQITILWRCRLINLGCVRALKGFLYSDGSGLNARLQQSLPESERARGD